MTIRATFSSYIALCGIWVILAILYLYLCVQHPGTGCEFGALISGGGGVFFAIWLRGFKITVSNEYLSYRNGWFISSRIPLNEIASIEDKWIEWDVFTRKVKVPRVVVASRHNETVIQINSKPFGWHDLQRIREKIETAIVPILDG